MSEEKMSDQELRGSLRGIRRQIAEAQSEGDSAQANYLYQQEQRLLAQQRGNRVVVGGRDPDSQHGSRGV